VNLFTRRDGYRRPGIGARRCQARVEEKKELGKGEIAKGEERGEERGRSGEGVLTYRGGGESRERGAEVGEGGLGLPEAHGKKNQAENLGARWEGIEPLATKTRWGECLIGDNSLEGTNGETGRLSRAEEERRQRGWQRVGGRAFERFILIKGGGLFFRERVQAWNCAKGEGVRV